MTRAPSGLCWCDFKIVLPRKVGWGAGWGGAGRKVQEGGACVRALCDPVDCSLPGSPSMEFSRQEYWSELPFPSPGDLPDPGIEPTSPIMATGFFTTEPPGKQHKREGICVYKQLVILLYGRN